MVDARRSIFDRYGSILDTHEFGGSIDEVVRETCTTSFEAGLARTNMNAGEFDKDGSQMLGATVGAEVISTALLWSERR